MNLEIMIGQSCPVCCSTHQHDIWKNPFPFGTSKNLPIQYHIDLMLYWEVLHYHIRYFFHFQLVKLDHVIARKPYRPITYVIKFVKRGSSSAWLPSWRWPAINGRLKLSVKKALSLVIVIFGLLTCQLVIISTLRSSNSRRRFWLRQDRMNAPKTTNPHMKQTLLGISGGTTVDSEQYANMDSPSIRPWKSETMYIPVLSRASIACATGPEPLENKLQNLYLLREEW